MGTLGQFLATYRYRGPVRLNIKTSMDFESPDRIPHKFRISVIDEIGTEPDIADSGSGITVDFKHQESETCGILLDDLIPLLDKCEVITLKFCENSSTTQCDFASAAHIDDAYRSLFVKSITPLIHDDFESEETKSPRLVIELDADS